MFLTDSLCVEFLADNQHLFSILEESYRTEWREYYGPRGQGNALSDIISFCNKDNLPICLVALKSGSLCGAVALRQQSGSHHHLNPWLTSLFVVKEERQKGIGTILVRAVENLAANLGFSMIYARTATAVTFFEKKTWIPFDKIKVADLTIFKKDLKP